MTHKHIWEIPEPTNDPEGWHPRRLFRCKRCGEIGYPIPKKAA